jgi:RNA polymerase sigma-70 factor (ECF subfamily)
MGGDVARLRRWDGPEDSVALEREPVTFETFFADEKDRLLRALYVITGNRGEAEDLTQEAFTRVFERWDRVSTMDDAAGYLHRTAMNLFRKQVRRARMFVQRTIGLTPEQDVFELVENRALIADMLASLTPRQRAALVLTQALGYSGEDAGRMLGIKASTVWALTHQARATLQAATEANDA